MPYNGSGTFEPLPPPTYPAVAGETIYAEYFNDVIQDIIDGLSNCVTVDGQSTMQGDLDMNGFSILNATESVALGLVSTSTTSLLISVASKALTVQAAKGYGIGMELIIARTSSPGNRMIGTCTAYNDVTGALTVSVNTIQGSGTYTDWTITPAVAPSFDNQTFDAGTFTNSTFTGNTFVNSTFTNYTETVKAFSAGTSFTCALADGTLFTCPTNGNATVTLPTPATGKSITVKVAYGGVHTLTWAVTGGSDIDWADNDTTPPATSVSGRTDLFTFTCLDGSSWLGISGGANYVQ